MAFQRSSVKLEGKIGDLSFYKVADEYHVKQSSGHSKERIAKDPNFERTRENATEFGFASGFAKQLKLSLKQVLTNSLELFHDPSLTNRLIKRISSTLKADSVNPRGKRTLIAENLGLLTGFSVNSNLALKDVLFIPLKPEWFMEDGLISLQLPAFNPNAAMDFPKIASQFRFHICALSLVDNTFNGVSTQSPLFALNAKLEAQSIDLAFTTQATDALMVFIGISFYSMVAGYPVPLTEPCLNALEIIKVFIKPNV